MKPIKLFTSYTFFEVRVKLGTPESYLIRNFVRSKLTEYRYNAWKKIWERVNNFIVVDENNNTIRFPIEFLDAFINNMETSGLEFDIQEYPNHYVPKNRPMKLRSSASVREKQKGAVEFLSNLNMSRKGLTLSPGVGKTFVSIYTIMQMQKVALIIVSRLTEQWLESIDKFTHEKKHTYVIKGIASLKKLLKSKLKPKIIICSLETLRPYTYNVGAYRELLPYENFLKRYDVGIKVIDEAHLNFHAGLKIDLKSIVPQNIYLTATFTKAGTVKRIFNKVYPDEIKYGSSVNTHTNITFYSYTSQVPETKCKTRRGYSHVNFEKYMLNQNSVLSHLMMDVVMPIINMHYIQKRKPKQKCLIFFSTIAMIAEVQKYLKQYYPKLNILTYISNDPDDNLKDGVDIILSTHKSCGVGTDIKNLKTCINTVSMASEALIIQVLGRLREMDGEHPEFVDMYDPVHDSHRRHYMIRSGIYKQMSNEYREIVL